MRVVPFAAALWAAHALAQSPAPAAPAPAPAPAAAQAPAPAPAPTTTVQPTTQSTAQGSTAAPSSGSSDVQYATYGGAPQPAPAPKDEVTTWGVLLDAGVPDGIGASAIFRPMSWLRVSAGGTYNFVSFGYRGGISVIPFYFPFSPSLNAEVGHFLAGDLVPILQQAFCADPTDPATCSVTIPVDNRILREVSYDYATAQLGLEFGIPKNFIFFLRLGASYIQTTLKGFEQVVQEAAGNDPTITARDLNIKVVAPSLKLGLIVYF